MLSAQKDWTKRTWALLFFLSFRKMSAQIMQHFFI